MDAFSTRTYATWELVWAPYDQPTYDFVLQAIRPKDIVLEIGAGDLRLAVQIARIAKWVFAIEFHPEIIERAFSINTEGLPKNLTVIPGDARRIPFPPGVNVGVLLMRHCTHFRPYASKLKSIGCERLITNARWRSGVEIVDLQMPRLPFESVKIGWYACWCGAIGFVHGPPEMYSAEMDQVVCEVSTCPQCV
jgi:hypothetical protein